MARNNIVAKGALAVALGILFLTAGARAHSATAAVPPTQIFHVAGTSTGVSWDYNLQTCTPGCAVVTQKTVGSVVSGAPCQDLVTAWVAKINEAPNAGFSAAILGDCNFSISSSNPFELWIVSPSCKVTNNLVGCSFNPTVTFVTSVGGVAESPDLNQLAAADQGGDSSVVPYAAGGGAAVLLAFVAVAAGAWYVRRRSRAAR